MLKRQPQAGLLEEENVTMTNLIISKLGEGKRLHAILCLLFLTANQDERYREAIVETIAPEVEGAASEVLRGSVTWESRSVWFHLLLGFLQKRRVVSFPRSPCSD